MFSFVSSYGFLFIFLWPIGYSLTCCIIFTYLWRIILVIIFSFIMWSKKIMILNLLRYFCGLRYNLFWRMYYILLLLLLSHCSHVWLCATPWTAAHQAPPSLGFSRQEHWSGLSFPSPVHESEKWKWSHSVMSDS